MARNYYKEGAAKQFINRKNKFGRYNLEKDLNTTIFSYQLKEGSGFAENFPGEENRTDNGATFSDFLKRIRLQGDANLTINLVKDKNLFPAGRLKALKGQTGDSPVFATDDEGGVFANSQNLSYTALLDILNLGGRDQMRFISEQELLTPEDIKGDKRNVGEFEVDGTANMYSFATELPTTGKVLVFKQNTLTFTTIDDLSTEEVEGHFVAFDDIVGMGGQSVHDVLFVESIESAIQAEKKDKILVLQNASGGYVLKEYILNSNTSVVVIEGEKTSGVLGTATQFKPRIIDSGDEYWYIHDLENNKILKVLKEDLSLVYEKVIDRPFNLSNNEQGFESIIETKEKLLGFRRGAKPEGLSFKDAIKERTIQETDYTHESWTSVDSDLTTSSGKYFAYVSVPSSKAAIYDFNGNLLKSYEDTDITVGSIMGVFENDKTLFLVTRKNIHMIDKLTNEYIRTLEIKLDNNEKVQDINFKNETSQIYFCHSSIEYETDVVGSKMKIYRYTLTSNATQETFDASLKKFENLTTNFKDTTAINNVRNVTKTGFFHGIAHFMVLVFPVGNESHMFDIETETFSSWTYGPSSYDVSDGDLTLFNGKGQFLRVYTGNKDDDKIKKGFSLETDNIHTAEFNPIPDKEISWTPYRYARPLNNNYFITKNMDSGKLVIIKASDYSEIFTDIDCSGTDFATSHNYHNEKNRDKYMGDYFWVPGVDKKYYFYEYNDKTQYFLEIDKDTLESMSPNSQIKKKKLGSNREVFITETEKEGGTNIIISGSGYVGYFSYESTDLLRSSDLKITSGLVGGNENYYLEAFDSAISNGSNNFIGQAINRKTFDIYKNADGVPVTFLARTNLGADSILIAPKPFNVKEENFSLSISKDFAVNGIEDRLFNFGNGMLSFTGIKKGLSVEKGGNIFSVWPTDDDEVDALGQEDRSEDIEGGNSIFGQQIYLTRSSRSTPTADGGTNHYSIDASRIDIPKFKNKSGEFINLNFLLDAAVKGENVKYIDLDVDAFVGLNQIQFLDDNEEVLPYEIADVNFETGEHAKDEEVLDPNLFNNGHGNEAWNLLKGYPIVNGSDIKWEFTDITTKRYYDALWESLYNDDSSHVENVINGLKWLGGGMIAEPLENWTDDLFLNFAGLNKEMKETMILDDEAQYMEIGTQLGKFILGREFSSEFLTAMYRGTVGAQITPGDGDKFSTNSSGNFGLDVADNRFFSMDALVNDPPIRRWPNSTALYMMDSFLVKGTLVLEDKFYISKMLPNHNLFNYDGSHTDMYKGLKNDHLKGSVVWNTATFDQKFVDTNGGSLTSTIKNSDVTSWSNSVQEDRKFLLMVPNDLEQVQSAIHDSGTGESPQYYETVTVTSGFFSGITAPRVDVPIAEGMYSRLSQEPFVNPEAASALGLRTNSKLRIVFDEPCTPNRIRVNGFGGGNWTWTEYDQNFNLAKDVAGDEVPPRRVQSPNVNKKPNDSFKDDLLSI